MALSDKNELTRAIELLERGVYFSPDFVDFSLGFQKWYDLADVLYEQTLYPDIIQDRFLKFFY